MRYEQRSVQAFHERFNLPHPFKPCLLPRDRHELRIGFIKEETKELIEALEAEDYFGTIDAIIDTIYFSYGTAVEMGTDLDYHFQEVQRANMDKIGGPIRADGKILKPAGWREPDHLAVFNAAWRGMIEVPHR